MISHPTPWRIEGDTIRDAAGGVVVSALNPCTMSTRRKIVDAVNEHDALKQRLKDAIDIADAFHKELQHVLDCLCYAGQTKSSLAGGAMEKPQTESPKGSTTWKGAFVPRAGEVDKPPKPQAVPCRLPPDAPGTCPPSGGMASGENRSGDLGRRSATDRGTPRKRCGASRDGCGLARGHGESLGHGAICFDCAHAIGLTPKGKAMGVWQDECCVCHKQKPCTDRWHDWNQPKES